MTSINQDGVIKELLLWWKNPTMNGVRPLSVAHLNSISSGNINIHDPKVWVSRPMNIPQALEYKYWVP